jgi:Zn-dependent protease with chaperone function
MSAKLYQAQAVANQVVNPNFFPCYSEKHIASKTGARKAGLFCYAKAYDVVDTIGKGWERFANLVSKAGSSIAALHDHALEKNWDAFVAKIDPYLSAVYPVNAVNGHRHFVGIPRKWEKWLGEHIFYPSSTKGADETIAHLPHDPKSMAQRVRDVANGLIASNDNILNPPRESARFNYRVKTIASRQLNAFCTPAGGMVVYSTIVEKIATALQQNKYRQIEVGFADGSKAMVDMNGITLDDCLAALMGHEMIHAASRHSMVSLAARAVRSVFLFIARYTTVAYLKSKDEEYVALKAKHHLNPMEAASLRDKERNYARINDFFGYIEKGIKHLTDLLLTRTNEYEADATGTWMAHQAHFNPLAGLYLHEVLKNESSEAINFLQKHCGFLFTHPHGDKRQRAILAVANEIAPDAVKERVTWHVNPKSKHHSERSDLARLYVRNAAAAV